MVWIRYWGAALLALAVGCAESKGISDKASGSGGNVNDGGGTGGQPNVDGGAGSSAAGGTSPGGAGGTSPGGNGGTSATGGAAGAAGSGGADPCANVTCNSPPGNQCADADNLTVYTATGTCSDGNCNYASHEEACAYGCNNGACEGDPCVGVTCNSPPASTCSDTTHLTVYDAPGSCDNGACSYSSREQYCSYGCQNDVCNGDPCIGVTCNSPSANYCSGANELTVWDMPGTCSNGNCSYTNHTEYCAFGCTSGACDGDPCAGVTCSTPPADYCTDANTLRTFSTTGTCDAGACSYSPVDQACVFGCLNGVCKDCATNGDCSAGNWCDAGTCKPCDTDERCGTACTNCTASGDVCNTAGTACVDCTADGHCGSGSWCDAGVCKACDTQQKCGASCEACGSNTQCFNGGCQVCKTSLNCGASCTACPSGTPFCLDQGSTSTCVECVDNSNCSGTDVCTNNACGPDGCPPPAEACVNGSQNRDRCSNARTISRTDAGAGGWSISDDTCGAYNRFDDCSWDAGDDHAYRIYLWQGETIDMNLSVSSTCPFYSYSWWDATLKVYSNAGCGDTTCSTREFCADHFEGNKSFTAPHDGWFIIVVDGSTAFDDEGDYTLTVNLTCGARGCGCS